MTKIDIISGFLGAGKTTLIKKLITEAYVGEKLVLIENEFGEIGIDGGFLADAGIQVNEMNSGCICCSLVGDFGKALKQVLEEYAPDRILIEQVEGAVLNGFTTVVDAGKCKMYMRNFGEFFNDQVENAGCIILSHTDVASPKKVEEAVTLLREHNSSAVIVTTHWGELSGAQLREATERTDTLKAELERLHHETEHHHHHHHDHDEECECHHEHHHHHDHDEECECHHEHHHHHDHDEECECHHEHHHHHDHDEECECHHEHHHHHDHDEECECHHEHHHHHDHGEECSCGCGGHHHHHSAHDVFVSCGAETTQTFDAADLADKLNRLCDEGAYGVVLRAKGIVPATDGRWIHFDYVPGEPDVRFGTAAVIGRLCVIGSGLNMEALGQLFGVALKASEA